MTTDAFIGEHCAVTFVVKIFMERLSVRDGRQSNPLDHTEAPDRHTRATSESGQR